MPNQKAHEFMNNLDRCYNVMLQSSAKGGISAIEIAEKLGKHRTTVHSYLNTLEYTGRVENNHGIWRVKTGEQKIKPLEKEIVIELPMPEKQLQRMVILEAMDQDWKETFPESKSLYRICLEKFKETRTIKVRGKNVDDLDLEKVATLIQQASEKSSKINLRGLLKRLKMPQANEPQGKAQ